ncbi:MAG: aldehyde reductase [Notoacmeibacter sp.]|nr:aldehyde reductase [Notoacmeibacter sp.]
MADTVLVTGISGFIAKHVALEFLKAGYNVRGTVRDMAKGDMVARTLAQHADVSGLSFASADLGSDAGWDAAMEGCTGVAHLASPFPLTQPKDENDLIRPAVDGTLRVLKAARAAGIQRFVQTSSTVAVSYGHGHDKLHFNEDDWSQLDGPGMTAYAKSKVLAERAARDFIAREGGDMHFATVNPALVLGPALDEDIGTSLALIQMFLTGKYPGAPKMQMPVVDVRDIARMHRLAMETSEPSGGRYVGCDEFLWFIDVAKALRDGLGEKGAKAPRRELPNALVRLIGLFDPAVRQIIPELGIERSLDNSRTRKALGIEFIPAREAAVASGRSLIDLGLV